MLEKKEPFWWSHSLQSWLEIEIFLNGCDNLKNVTSKELINKSNWEPISIGRSNHSYCLTLGHTKYFVQIINSTNNIFLPYECAISLNNILGQESYEELSTWLVVTFFQSRNVKIQEWFESETVSARFSHNDEVIDFLARFLAKLHECRPVKLPEFNLYKHLCKYKNIAISNKRNINAQKEINLCFKKAVATLKSYKPGFLCHYDLNLNNVLFNKNTNTLKVIDWEYTCIGDPILDLTALINNLKLTKVKKLNFISNYRRFSTNSNMSSQFFGEKKLYDMKLLNECIYELWVYGQPSST